MPQVLPGGKAVLFSSFRLGSADANRVEVFSFTDRRRKTLAQGGMNACYLSTGHLIYTIKGTLFAVPFDPDRLETRGTPVPVLDDVAFDPQDGSADISVPGSGTLVYRPANLTRLGEMTTVRWVDGAGETEALPLRSALYRDVALSPDGKKLLLTLIEGGSRDVWVYDPQRDARTRLTAGGYNWSPLWSPDGRFIVFAAVSGIYWTRVDGAGQPQRLTVSKNTQWPESFTPDGKRLAYAETIGDDQIWTLPLEEQNGQLKAGSPEQFIKSRFSDRGPAFSRDGRWLAYSSNESGNREVYVRAFPDRGGKWQISDSGGANPSWSRTRRELFYESGDHLMAVKYSVNGDSFAPEKPRVWIDKLGGSVYDLSPDGKRAIVLTPEPGKADHEVTFLFNFFDYLRTKVPLNGK